MFHFHFGQCTRTAQHSTELIHSSSNETPHRINIQSHSYRSQFDCFHATRLCFACCCFELVGLFSFVRLIKYHFVICVCEINAGDKRHSVLPFIFFSLCFSLFCWLQEIMAFISSSFIDTDWKQRFELRFSIQFLSHMIMSFLSFLEIESGK